MTTHRWPIALAAIVGLSSSTVLGLAPAQTDGAAHAAAYRLLAYSPGTVPSTEGGDAAGGRTAEKADPEPAYDCTGVEPTDKGKGYLCDNWRLGPKELPTSGPVADLLKGYDRLGGEKKPKAFLDKWWDSSKNNWKYPPADGFVTGPDGKPKFVAKPLPKGLKLSRFGPEKDGKYMALANAPYAKRALPPSSLDTREDGCQNGLHLYEVQKPMTGEEGFLVPAFGQPGGGAQYYSNPIGGSVDVTKLVELGYLKRLNCAPKR